MNSINSINNNYPQQRVNFGSYSVKPEQLGAPALKGFTDVTDLSEHVPYLSAQQFDGISEHLQKVVQAGKKLLFSPDEMKEINAVRNDRGRMELYTYTNRGIQGATIDDKKTEYSKPFYEKFIEIFNRATDFEQI